MSLHFKVKREKKIGGPLKVAEFKEMRFKRYCWCQMQCFWFYSQLCSCSPSERLKTWNAEHNLCELWLGSQDQLVIFLALTTCSSELSVLSLKNLNFCTNNRQKNKCLQVYCSKKPISCSEEKHFLDSCWMTSSVCANYSLYTKSYLGSIVQYFNMRRLVIMLASDSIQHYLIFNSPRCFPCHYFFFFWKTSLPWRKGERCL